MVLGGESSFGKNGKPTSPSPPAAPCARHPHPVSPCVPPYGTALYPGLPGPPGMLPYLWIPCACPLCGARRRLGGGGREGTVGGTWATPASGLRTRTQLSPVRDGRGLDAPRKPRDGFSRLGREEQHSAQAGGVQHRGAERAPPAPRRSRTVRDKRDEKPPSPAR